MWIVKRRNIYIHAYIVRSTFHLLRDQFVIDFFPVKNLFTAILYAQLFYIQFFAKNQGKTLLNNINTI